ncbi:MAG TPA: type II secretion system protein GspM [Anaeromyxobacter sp.]
MNETWKQLRSQVETWVRSLAPRERLMVGAAAASIAIFLVWLASFSIGKAIDARERSIEQKTRVLSQVGKLADTYRRREAERKDLEARLKGSPVALMSHIAQAGATLGIPVNDLRPSTSPGDLEGVREETVEVNLARIELTRLSALLQSLERGAGVVRVRRIRVTTRSDDPALVDATLLVATYQLKS